MTSEPNEARWNWAGRAVVLAAALVAVVGARPYAGGWNDGSRLAAAESLGGAAPSPSMSPSSSGCRRRRRAGRRRTRPIVRTS